jgi:hypothetical protein
MNQFNDNFTPKKIGNFNIPKNVIECKIDTLAVLELLLRKNVASWEEIDEIREAVVMHMNVMYPELQLTYSTPQPMKDEAPIGPPDQPQKPLFYSAPPPEVANMGNTPEVKEDPKAKPPLSSTPPLYQNAQPPKITSSMPRPGGPSPARPVTLNQPVETPSESAPAAGTNETNPAQPVPNPNAPKPMFPNAGPPKILSNPPRKKI